MSKGWIILGAILGTLVLFVEGADKAPEVFKEEGEER